jgi:hypothetical protein
MVNNRSLSWEPFLPHSSSRCLPSVESYKSVYKTANGTTADFMSHAHMKSHLTGHSYGLWRCTGVAANICRMASPLTS